MDISKFLFNVQSSHTYYFTESSQKLDRKKKILFLTNAHRTTTKSQRSWICFIIYKFREPISFLLTRINVPRVKYLTLHYLWYLHMFGNELGCWYYRIGTETNGSTKGYLKSCQKSLCHHHVLNIHGWCEGDICLLQYLAKHKGLSLWCDVSLTWSWQIYGYLLLSKDSFTSWFILLF